MKEETLNLRNQEATLQLMQNQMGQMAKILQERQQGVLPSNTIPNPREQINSITNKRGLICWNPLFHPCSSYSYRGSGKVRKTLMDEVLEKLGDPRKFLIPYVLQDLKVCNSLADSGVSTNLMPFSIYEKLGTGPLKPTRMTLKLANRSITYAIGIAEDVIVKVDKFIFLADFVIVDFEADPRVPIILGRPFLRTAKARKSSSSTTSQSDHSLPDYEAFCFDHQEEKRSGSTTSHYDPSLLEYESFYFDILIDTLPPADRSDSNHEEFADELAHIISPPEYDNFYFDIEDVPGDLTRLLIENPSSKNVNLTEIKEDNELKPKTSTKELTIYELNDLRVKFKRSHILSLNDFSPISFVSDLLLTDPSEIKTFRSFPSKNEDKVFDLVILLIDENLHIY
ncbi:reverse transcriptase domain-containing protein [Tanacetum coccineum]